MADNSQRSGSGHAPRVFDPQRIGRSLRAIRIRLGWRQMDLALRAKVSRAFVSKVERGLFGSSEFAKVQAICAALGADLDVRVRWRGEGLDRLLDEGHATLVDLVVGLLRAAGWEVALEVTFNVYGDRGSIDILAWHPGRACAPRRGGQVCRCRCPGHARPARPQGSPRAEARRRARLGTRTCEPSARRPRIAHESAPRGQIRRPVRCRARAPKLGGQEMDPDARQAVEWAAISLIRHRRWH